ncbi:TPA: hypothetical protein DCE37_15085 [Candidatus Latescibacteria bacterium]|nr:hypothetical protein [Candidatus Latescibacterota bacterium]
MPDDQVVLNQQEGAHGRGGCELRSVLRKLYVSIGLGAAVFLGFSVYLDSGLLIDAFKRFAWQAGAAALILAAFNYIVRFWRWHLYLRRLGAPVQLRDSLRIFLSGLALSVTPGKAGELLKAYLVRKSSGAPIGLGVSAVFAERLTDFVSLLLLSMFGIYSHKEGAWTLVLAGAGTVSIFLVIFVPGAIPAILRLLDGLPLLHRLVEPARDAYQNARLLLAPGMLIQGLAIGVAAWLAECLGLYYILLGFGATVDVASAAFIYAFATIFGALTLLPGGIGTTEGSMTGLLTLEGLPLADAVAATFVIRVCTLWFAVAIGAVVLITSAAEKDLADALSKETTA